MLVVTIVALAATARLAPLVQDVELAPQAIPLYGEDERFGASVALDGLTAAVGSPTDANRIVRGVDDGEGSVYVYSFDGVQWNEMVELIGDTANGSFGTSLDLQDDVLVVGGPGRLGGGVAGHVKIYRNVAGVWQEEARLQPASGNFNDRFGFTVARDGDRLAVGAFEDGQAGPSTGAVYIYEKAGSSWNEVSKLSFAQYENFGVSLDLEGERLAVGAFRDNGVAVFDRLPNGVWTLDEFVFDPLRVGDDDSFGRRVILRGDELYVGAPAYAQPGHITETGLVYAYDRSGGSWMETQRLEGSEPSNFNSAIELDGTRLLVGANDRSVHSFVSQGGAWQPEAIASNPAPSDGLGFGSSIALDGDRFLVGAWGDDTFGPDSGGAYFFEWNGAAWEVESSVVPAAGDSFNFQFGSSVGLDGELLATGAPGELGLVYAYQRGTSGWEETSLLSPAASPEDGDFGSALNLLGDWLLVGAPTRDWVQFAGDDAGAVFVYEWDGNCWSTSQNALRNTSPEIDASSGALFGASIDADGSWVVIGSPKQTKISGVMTGFAFLFKRINGSGFYQYRTHLGPMNSFGGMRYGDAVAITGLTVAVCSSLASRVDIYMQLAGSWIETQRITDPATGLGVAVELDGNTMAVSTTAPPSVRIYERPDVSQPYVLSQVLAPAEVPTPESFGVTLDLGAKVLVVGAPDSGTPDSAGLAYVFRRAGGRWVQTQRYQAASGAAGDRLGASVGLSGTTIAVGVPGRESAAGVTDEGVVLVTEILDDRFTFCSCDRATTCGNETVGSGCANSTGFGASIDSTGSTSITTDDLSITVSGLPPNVSGLIFRGTRARAPAPFGDGRRCVFSQIRRGPVRNTGMGGTLSLGPGYVTSENGVVPPGLQILVGQTWYFQGYYRDSGGPCGTQFSASNALGVIYGP